MGQLPNQCLVQTNYTQILVTDITDVCQLCPNLCDPMDCIPEVFSYIEFSRQEYWSGLPFPTPGDLPNSGTELRSPALQAVSLLSEPPGKPPLVETYH